MIDLKDLAWKDNDNADFHRIMKFEQRNDVDLVWYINVESLEEHCMDAESFLRKYTAAGLFDDFEPA